MFFLCFSSNCDVVEISVLTRAFVAFNYFINDPLKTWDSICQSEGNSFPLPKRSFSLKDGVHSITGRYFNMVAGTRHVQYKVDFVLRNFLNHVMQFLHLYSINEWFLTFNRRSTLGTSFRSRNLLGFLLLDLSCLSVKQSNKAINNQSFQVCGSVQDSSRGPLIKARGPL